MENIIENNKIIAEFLDWEFDDLSETFETPFLKLVEPHAFGDGQFSCKLQDFELEFHTDWNWLMKLVEKIEIQSEELFGAYEDVIINGCGCGIATKDDMISIAATSKIVAVYIACVEYIKWYNEQNKNSESL